MTFCLCTVLYSCQCASYTLSPLSLHLEFMEMIISILPLRKQRFKYINWMVAELGLESKALDFCFQIVYISSKNSKAGMYHRKDRD